MRSPRTTAAVVGVLYIIGTAAGVSSVAAVGGLLDGPDVLGPVAGHPDRLRVAALCILLMGIALAPIPAVLYPLLSRLDRPLAVGYVIVRGALETVTYLGTVRRLPASRGHGGAGGRCGRRRPTCLHDAR